MNTAFDEPISRSAGACAATISTSTMTFAGADTVSARELATVSLADGGWNPTNGHCRQFGADAGNVDYGLSSTLAPHSAVVDPMYGYMQTVVPCGAPVHLYCYGALSDGTAENLAFGSETSRRVLTGARNPAASGDAGTTSNNWTMSTNATGTTGNIGETTSWFWDGRRRPQVDPSERGQQGLNFDYTRICCFEE